jgi:hypothetical protein
MPSTAIAVFAFRRPGHLSRVLASLVDQRWGTSLPVHLFLDGPRHQDDEEAVMATRLVAEAFVDRLRLSIHAAPVNRGLYNALTTGVGSVLADHEQVIVLEDDIFVSSYFLEYILAALACYVNTPKVCSIHGYLPPLSMPMPETFFLRGADCWGWATWRDRWRLYRHDAAAMAAEIRQRGLVDAFNLGGGVSNLKMLDQRAAGRSKSWAICWHASCFLAERYTLHPGRSLVRNIGLDDSGEHCAPSAALEASLSDTPIRVTPQPVLEDPAIVAALGQRYAVPPLPRRLLNRLQSLRQQCWRLAPLVWPRAGR